MTYNLAPKTRHDVFFFKHLSKDTWVFETIHRAVWKLRGNKKIQDTGEKQPFLGSRLKT